MIQFSKAVETNLGPLFKAWNIPVSKKALDNIKHFKEFKVPECIL